MSSSTIETIRLHGSDNVVTAKVTIPENTKISEEELITSNEIPVGHKVATSDITTGQPIRKYDQIIGFASSNIKAGEHVHTQNVEMQSFDRDYKFGVDAKNTPGSCNQRIHNRRCNQAYSKSHARLCTLHNTAILANRY